MPPINAFSRKCLALAVSQALLIPTHAATIEVNDDADTDGADAICTLREAIVSANTNPGNTTNGCTSGDLGTDTITFSSAVVAGGDISITQAANLTVTEGLIINGPTDAPLSISGMGNSGVFYVTGASLTLNDLTITGGTTASGGGIIARNSSVLTINNSSVSGNTAGYGAGVFAQSGSSITLHNSTLANNTANYSGGGISASATVVSLSNSTVSGNSAGFGGGIYSSNGTSVSLRNSTVSANSATSAGAGIHAAGSSSVSLYNNIVAGNISSSGTGVAINNGAGSSTFVTSHNLLGDDAYINGRAFDGFTPDSTDIVASRAGPLPTAIEEIIKPLADNGGGTQTHALVAGSPALSAGDGSICTTAPVSSEDQRGLPRTNDCDIGAVEAQIVTITVDTVADTSGTLDCTLRNAIMAANTNEVVGGCSPGSDNEEIQFDLSEFPPESANTIILSTTLPAITSDLTIAGQGTPSLTIDANSTGRVLTIQYSAVSLSNLTITGGSATNGAGIYSVGSNLAISNSTVSGNSANSKGGGITSHNYSSLSISNSVISNNSANNNVGGVYINMNTSASLYNTTVSGNFATNNGGGILVDDDSSMSISNSTVVNNSANNGAGVLAISSSILDISNSTISGNLATNSGGGVFAILTSSINLGNSTVTYNSAATAGGGIYAKGVSSLSLENSIVSGNLGSMGAEINNDLSDSTFTTYYNLLGDSSHTHVEAFANFTPNHNDINATSTDVNFSTHLPTSISSILAPLANNGGVTETHALVEGSPAIDAGDDAKCVGDQDQRGEQRPSGDSCDIGSFEVQNDDGEFFVVPLPGGRSVTFSL